MKWCIIILAMLAFELQAKEEVAATGNLKGIVLDSVGNPIAGATIRVINTSKGAISSGDGKFSIAKLEAGKYNAEASSVGCEPLAKEIKIESGKTTSATFILEEVLIECQEVILECEKMINMEQKGGGRVSTANVTSLASLTAGVTTNGNSFIVRGSRSDQTQIRVDGMNVSDQFIGGYGSQFGNPTGGDLTGSYPDPHISRAASEGGDGIDLGNFSENIDFNDPSINFNSDSLQILQLESQLNNYQNYFKELANRHYVFENESYSFIEESSFKDAKQFSLSTFSIDVDKASYSNVRRMIEGGNLPPKDAVRIEEFINYFNYEYLGETKHPVKVHSKVAECPWNKETKLMLVGLQAIELERQQADPLNLVFLVDVSGSMNSPNKLPLVKKSLETLTKQMRSEDRISMVVYSGAAGLVLESTSGSEKDKILSSIENLSAGGSTAGGEGIKLAYKIAKENFIDNGVNRVVICTDGDFNTGPSSDSEMQRLIESKRDDDIFLTCLGFGMGNYKDSKLETLANKGNGNYGYIDDERELNRFLFEDFLGNLYTVAKDVKFQIEFNPAKVAHYKLIGYANRMLNAEDFDDDKKDAGEIGSGQTVTAIYEIIPKQEDAVANNQDGFEMKYQQKSVNNYAESSNELANIRLRYKMPESDTSVRFDTPVEDSSKKIDKRDKNFNQAVAASIFGMCLRSTNPDGSSLDMAKKMVSKFGNYKLTKEFIGIIEQTEKLKDSIAKNEQ